MPLAQLPRGTSSSVDLRFKDIFLSVEVSPIMGCLTGEKAGTRDILKGVSGVVKSGQILAVIGSSGAGKTSLLDVLVGKITTSSKGLTMSGSITVNGRPISRSFFLENAAYVLQDDRLWSALTVRENLAFACKLYEPTLSQSECDGRVGNVLASLGVESCQHTKVGNAFFKGISGGQKRRTSIGVELVVQRKLLFLDEPTSGLDAASASGIMSLLKRLTSDTGLAVVTSVHQPSSQVFQSFDQVILLTMGQTAYFGPAADSLGHFASLGHTPKGMVNPADYLLEMTNADFSDGEAVQCLLDAWHETLAWRELEASLASTAPPPLPSQPKPRGLTVGRQVKTLVARAATNNSRDPAAYPFRLVLYFGMSIFLGSVYSRIENRQSDVLNRVYLIIWINAFNSYMDMAAIPVFSQEKEAIVKEVQNGQYSVGTFCVANAIVQTPFVFLMALCCSTPVYWITDMNDNLVRFVQFILVVFMMLLVVESIAQVVGALIKNLILAIAVFACLMSQFFMFNGFFIDPNHTPGCFAWISWVSPLKYSWEMLAKIVFEGETFSDFDTCITCYGKTGEEVLDSLSNGGTNLRDVDLASWCGVMMVLAIGWRVAHFLTLSRWVV